MAGVIFKSFLQMKIIQILIVDRVHFHMDQTSEGQDLLVCILMVHLDLDHHVTETIDHLQEDHLTGETMILIVLVLHKTGNKIVLQMAKVMMIVIIVHQETSKEEHHIEVGMVHHLIVISEEEVDRLE